MNNLFGTQTIPSISYDNGEIIRYIMHLFVPSGKIDVDPTYSIGSFYKNYGIPEPTHKFDINPQANGVIQADARSLPLKDESVQTVMFDPPFVLGGVIKDTTDPASCKIQRRFSHFKNFDELKSLYADAMKEFYRILLPGGILIFKCQDVVSSTLNNFSHVWIFNQAIELGYSGEDLFVLLAKNRLHDGRKQRHARKYHCYFWVFKKKKEKIDYSLLPQ